MRNIYSHLNFKAFINLSFILFCFISYSQVGIGNTNPNSNALLEVGNGADTGGVLLPRVNLTATDDPSPLSTDVAGMIVYNTNTQNDVTPGFYYNDGTDWVRLGAGGSSSDDWTITGNNNTTPASNYIGSSNGVDVVFATNGSENMRLVNGGQVSVNNTSPLAVDLFTATAAADDYAVNGYSTGAGVGVYGENSSNGLGVFGNAANIGVLGFGIIGQQGETIGAGTGVIGYANNASALGGYFRNDTGSGLLAVANGSSTTYYLNTGGTFHGNSLGGAGVGHGISSTGLAAAGDGVTTITTLVDGSGIAGVGDVTGVFGLAIGGGGESAGGYFDNTNTYSYIAYTSGPPGPSINYKIIGNGNVSTLIKDSHGTPRVLFAPESPEIVFQDFGIGQLTHGKARIKLDPILKESLHIDNENPLKVYVTLEGECNGVYVTDKSADGFTVKELKGGTSNISFSWQIVANRADSRDENGNIISKHVGIRLPVGPNRLEKQSADKLIKNKVHHDLKFENNMKKIK